MDPVVASLLEIADRAHTPATLTSAATEALALHLPVRWFELGLCDAARVRADALVHRPGEHASDRATRRLRGSLAGAALEGGARIADAGRARTAAWPELRRAVGAAATRLAVAPLRDADGGGAYVMIALGAGRASSQLDVGVLEEVAAVLGLVLRHARRLARVAALSRRALGESGALRAELREATPEPPIVASDPAMRALVHDLLPLVARHETTVLLRGETGTGKEILARRVHALSRRAERPFVRVNCGAIPEALVESTLFGHEAGAFTGAIRRHTGVFERAHGGTLFLDEVAELPPAVQVKLLRVLQENEIERVGGEAPIGVDVRIIAATHRPLEALVEAGRFRHDLFYRLDVFPVVIPPLRERPADIAPLSLSILARLARHAGRTPPRLDRVAHARLAAHPWPGNVRELENVLERAFVLSRGGVLSVAPLEPAPARAARTLVDASPARGPVETYRAATAKCIEAALAACGGRIYGPRGAASVLGLKPTTLQSKMKKLGIEPRGR